MSLSYTGRLRFGFEFRLFPTRGRSFGLNFGVIDGTYVKNLCKDPDAIFNVFVNFSRGSDFSLLSKKSYKFHGVACPRIESEHQRGEFAEWEPTVQRSQTTQ